MTPGAGGAAQPGSTAAGTGGPGLDQVTALLSASGQELLARVAAGRAAGEPALALATRLRRDYPADLVAAATAQDELRRAGAAKFSRAGRMLFTRPGLEQASSETAARHRARRFAEATVARLADLGCGIGGDLIALAAGREVLAVDRDAVHLRMAAHNAGVYDVAAGVRTGQADVRDVDLRGVGAVFADPARRLPGAAAAGGGPGRAGTGRAGFSRAGGRRLRPGDSEPPLDWCFALTGRVGAVAVKAAPGLPAGIVPPGWETEFVADGRDLKEAVLWSPALATARVRATILPEGHTLLPGPGEEPGQYAGGEPGEEPGKKPGQGAADKVPVAPPGAFLFDPNPAVTRAGLVETLARQIGAWKIDPRIAFLSAGSARTTPFARTLRVVESAPWNEKDFGRRLRALGIGAADLRRRGLAGDVDQIHRRLKLAGPYRATLVLTRVNDKPWGLICMDPD
ncbi:MAG: class I SAM-dependent methyltransferase [Streptosporangiaceae bacterium]